MALTSEGQGAKQKSAEGSQVPWYQHLLTNASTERLAFWAAMITTGKWGAVTGDSTEAVSLTEQNRKVVSDFILKAAKYHFGPKGSQQLPSPPMTEIRIRQGWTTSFTWEICDYYGHVVDATQSRTVYAPGRTIHTKMTVITPPAQDKGKGKAQPTPPPPTTAPRENSWQELPNLPENPWKEASPNKRSFARVAATGPKPKVTGPQTRYENVPVTKFMAPPQKKQQRKSGGYGKRYMVKFGKDEKPTNNTKLPIQIVVSEVNRACSELNIKANSAEWTSALNLQIYFTYDSIDSQIEKARATILGLVAKGCPKTQFMKSVKWARIVVRNVPTKRWTSDVSGMVDEDTGAPHGSFVDVNMSDVEAELRASHPLLTEATFVEGPSWTAKSGFPPAGAETANVSFTIPDPDDSKVKALVARPLIIFHTPCRCSQWTEKINLTQCTRCWKYGDKVHPECPIRCRRCGGNHEETDHNKSCKKCEKEDINHEDRKRGLTVCDHPVSCPNCGEPHHANDSSCRMRNHAACEERRRRKVGQGQTFISRYTETAVPLITDP
jgi:hypothetical protein